MEQKYLQETAWLEMDTIKTFFFLLKKVEIYLLAEQDQNQGEINLSL